MKAVLRLATAGALALGLAACSGNSATPSGTKFAEGKTFTMILSADPGNLDPHFTSLSTTQQVDRFLYDSLINIDKDGKMVAGLAEKWEATTTKAVFTLRKGVTCSDGSPLTATQIAANITFVGDPKNASSRIGVYVPPGATATADDAAGTVTVTSPAPSAFLDRTLGGLHIVCDKGMKDRTLLKQGAVGTGLFTVTEAVADDHYTLKRRKDYAWGPGDWSKDQAGLPETVVLKVVANETTAANLISTDQANAAVVVGPDGARLTAMNLHKREVVAPLGELWFNQKAGLPGADAATRKALTQALDLKQLMAVITSGSGKPATGLVAPGLGPCPQDTVTSKLPASDAAAAKTALSGKNLKLNFYYASAVGPGMQAAAELLQKAWQAAGVEVTLKGVTNAEIGQAIVGGQGSWDAAFLPLGVTLPSELVSFFSGPSAPDGVNFASINNPAYTAAVEKASATAGTAGCAQWAAAEEALVGNGDIVPFAFSSIGVYGKGATFELSSGSVDPASVRMLG
ncbi:peptide ABC transporter substrate-binding protein [Rhizocola hellebori]|uniref:Peptide ABC transporter substrate-binding protein n=2 Tax=Rhizocola hellebori TaxID=1392758 RepID=A0A8J3Q2C4_9ACTN|nr:peptide ABC transporter substrate-binding protein [Rhizocola hellebori]